jgi:putative transposase
MLPKLAYLTLCRSVQLPALLGRGDASKDLEILVLRHQLRVLRRQVPRPRLEPADRALLAAVSRVLPRVSWSCFFVKPDTLLGWHRRLVAGAWTYARGAGRPPLDQQVQQLIVRLARENPRWGYQRGQAEHLADSLGKGDRVMVTGRLRQPSWGDPRRRPALGDRDRGRRGRRLPEVGDGQGGADQPARQRRTQLRAGAAARTRRRCQRQPTLLMWERLSR